ncbi:TPA: S8 family serine peptidase, partial [Streptococcus pneumoniae]|nr:S8 family serine peptidase [Streptococcus pneumoniae]
VLSLTTAAVILAAYAPNEVVLADTSSSEDALSISDKEKVAENKEKHEDIHSAMETSKDTEEKKATVIEEKEVVSKNPVIDTKTSNEEARIKEDSNQSQGDNAHSSANKGTENPKKEDRLVYIAEFKDKESGEKAIKELSSLKNTKVLYTYDRIFNGSAIETTPDNLDKIKQIEGISSIERAQKVQPMMNHARKEIGVEEAIDYLKSINAPFGKNFDGRGMVISNIDTGTDYRHKAMRIDDDAKASMRFKKEDLKGTDKNYWLSDKIPHAFNYYNGGKITVEKYDDGRDYFDPHGMHIAGILAGNDTEQDIKNFNGIDGIAPNAQIFSYKMYSDAGSGFAGDETMFHAIEDSIKHNVDVVSVSSGFTGTGLVGEKYWQAIRALRKAGIPMVVATGNYATSASSSSWDLVANNHLKMTDTGNVTRTAAHEDAIAVASAKNQTVEFDKVNIGGESFKYRNIGAFFDKNKIT